MDVEVDEDEVVRSPLETVDAAGGLRRGGVFESVSAPVASGSVAPAVVSVRLALASGEPVRAGLTCWRTGGDAEEGETGDSFFSIMTDEFSDSPHRSSCGGLQIESLLFGPEATKQADAGAFEVTS